MFIRIKSGSLTNAQRAVKILRNNRYKPLISRLENPAENDGCGYIVRVSAENADVVRELLDKNRIGYIGVDAE